MQTEQKLIKRIKKKQDKEAIEKYQKEHLFGVCSGRPRCALFDLKQLKLDFYILSSGAVILDKDLNIIQDFPMKKEIVQQIFIELAVLRFVSDK